jgi:hypothetical protein
VDGGRDKDDLGALLVKLKEEVEGLCKEQPRTPAAAIESTHTHDDRSAWPIAGVIPNQGDLRRFAVIVTVTVTLW